LGIFWKCRRFRWIYNFELFAQAVHPLALLGILRPRRARFKLADHKDAQPNGSIA